MRRPWHKLYVYIAAPTFFSSNHFIILGLHSLCYRRGEELKWFSPSVFIYLASVVPAIWFLELDAKRNEILCIYVEIVKNDNLEADMVTMLMDLMQVSIN